MTADLDPGAFFMETRLRVSSCTVEAGRLCLILLTVVVSLQYVQSLTDVAFPFKPYSLSWPLNPCNSAKMFPETTGGRRGGAAELRSNAQK